VRFVRTPATQLGRKRGMTFPIRIKEPPSTAGTIRVAIPGYPSAAAMIAA
jgi:hypothetical protein